jgi:hypothetical protein
MLITVPGRFPAAQRNDRATRKPKDSTHHRIENHPSPIAWGHRRYPVLPINTRDLNNVWKSKPFYYYYDDYDDAVSSS